mgnify:CR=1 FL=1
MAGKSIDDKTIWTLNTTGVEYDPFGNRWENHPASVENQLKDEPTSKYGLSATEILKSEYPHIYSDIAFLYQ